MKNQCINLLLLNFISVFFTTLFKGKSAFYSQNETYFFNINNTVKQITPDDRMVKHQAYATKPFTLKAIRDKCNDTLVL